LCQFFHLMSPVSICPPELYTELGTSRVPFSKVLEASMCKTNVTQAWCEVCKKYTIKTNIKRFRSLPSTFAVNTGLENAPVSNKFLENY